MTSGSWWDESIADFNAKLKEQQSKLDDFNKKSSDAAKDAAAATQQAMKNAADAMVRLAFENDRDPRSLRDRRQRRGRLPDGGDECLQGKGFQRRAAARYPHRGEMHRLALGVRTNSARLRDCPVETVVLRAACQ